jgi:predicted anti-sigma-YlaC factor YlaD
VNCLEAIDLIGDAMESKLPGEIGIDFDEHMRECSPCRNYYEQLRLTRMALREIPRSGATSPNRDLLIEKFREESEQ